MPDDTSPKTAEDVAALAAAEARWRAEIQDHGSDTTAPRIDAWRKLESLRNAPDREGRGR